MDAGDKELVEFNFNGEFGQNYILKFADNGSDHNRVAIDNLKFGQLAKNDMFTLDTNGTLKTATTFDYESNATSYTITVQAKDELNATTEGNFTVALLDAYEDTDGDGFRDSLEASAGSNLNDPTAIPFKDGLVAWYPFDGNASDMSGNGNDGNITGSPEWVFSEGHHSIKFTEYAQSVISPIEDFNENFLTLFGLNLQVRMKLMFLQLADMVVCPVKNTYFIPEMLFHMDPE